MQIFDGKRTEHITDYTPHLATNNEIALLLAVQNNNKAKVQELIDAGTNVNLEYTFNNPKMTTTPLASAAGLGLTGIATLLLDAKASLNGCSGKVPAIEQAVQSKHEEMIKLLIAHGAETTSWHAKPQEFYQKLITETSWSNWILLRLMVILSLPSSQTKTNTK